ncbi:MAG: ABC transporter ATP-binding protein, partial [Pseudomonadota bacterium]
MANPGPDKAAHKGRSDSARMVWLWRTYARRHLPLIVFAALLMAIEGSILGGVSLLMEPMFDRVFVEGSQSALMLVGGGFLGLFALRAVTSTSQRVLMTWIAQRISAHIRQDLMRHAMTLDGDFHATHPPGYMIERVHGDTAMVVKTARTILMGLARDVVALIVLFSVAASIDPIWTAITLIGIPLLFAPAIAIQSYIRRKSTQAREVAARMALRLDEVFHGINTVKLSRLESYQQDRYRAANVASVRTETKSELGRALIPGLIDILTGLGIVGVLIYGGNEIVSGEKSVGEFMAFFTAIALAFEPVRKLGNLSGASKTLAASLERIQDIFETRPRLTRPAQPKAPAPGDIVFDNVSVAFGETRALNGLSFTAHAGETTAFVGASGAGKSTVFHTLTRLAGISGGHVTLAGTDITEADPGDLRGLVSVVSQDALLFDDTLRENITFGQDITDERLEAALRDAHVADFLPGLPQGLDSPAGPRGSNLSGGQRQRISIA